MTMETRRGSLLYALHNSLAVVAVLSARVAACFVNRGASVAR